MIVRFIAHAGIYLQEDGYSVLIDPWFRDSTPEYPVMQSIGGGFDTIDFQIPETPEHIERYMPDAIAVSHFHPHHAPARDIRTLSENTLANARPMHLLHPTPDDAIEEKLAERIAPGVTRHPMEPGERLSVGPFTIEAKEHTVPFHRAWYLTSPTGSVLHIGDGRINKDVMDRRADAAWQALAELAPSILFLSSGGHSARITQKDGSRDILDAGIFTPIEAARIAAIVKPKAVAALGFYNHSIFKNRTEYILPASQTEEEFTWALTWLAPDIRNVRLTPGMTFGIGNVALSKQCDILVES